MNGIRSYYVGSVDRFLLYGACVNSLCPERVKPQSEVCVCQRQFLISGQPGALAHIHVCYCV